MTVCSLSQSMSKETWFTFMLSENCDLTLDIYTITGKKVHHQNDWPYRFQ